MMAATPLTEEEAQAELRAERQARENRRRQDRAPAPSPSQAETPEHLETAESTADDRHVALVSIANGRLTLSLNTAACVAAAGFICVLVLVGYSLGRRTREPLRPLPAAAAVVDKPSVEGEPAHIPPASAQPVAAQRPPIPPDLSALLQQPPSRKPLTVQANRPSQVAPGQTPPAGLAENLNYLQIESFLITRDRSGDQIAQDVAAVRSFLAERGVRTFARRRANGYLLFAEQGFEPGREHAAERDRFRRRIEQLGREYRGAGGLYQFKGCLFVSYAHTRVGDPA